MYELRSGTGPRRPGSDLETAIRRLRVGNEVNGNGITRSGDIGLFTFGKVVAVILGTLIPAAGAFSFVNSLVVRDAIHEALDRYDAKVHGEYASKTETERDRRLLEQRVTLLESNQNELRLRQEQIRAGVQTLLDRHK